MIRLASGTPIAPLVHTLLSRALANTPHQVVCPARGNCQDRQSTLHSGAAISEGDRQRSCIYRISRRGSSDARFARGATSI